MARQRVLFVSPSDRRGGAERYLLAVAAAARDAGWQIGLGLARGPATAPLARSFRSLGGGVHALPSADPPAAAWWPRQLARVKAALGLAALLARLRPAVVHLNLPWPVYGLPYVLTCALLRQPAIVVFHAVPDDLVVGRARRAYRWAQRRRQVWVVVADHQRPKLAAGLGVPANRIARIYNGVAAVPAPTLAMQAAARERVGLAPDAFVVASVGRLSEGKGQADLVEAVAMLRGDVPRARALIVGEGDSRPALTAQIATRGLTGVVELRGERDDVPDTLAATDVFAFPSRAEGFPLALLEAMAAGCAVVATAFDGVHELVEDGVSGLIVPVGRPPDLAAALRTLAEDPALRDRLAAGARSRATRFTRERSLGEMLALYERAPLGWRIGMAAPRFVAERIRAKITGRPPLRYEARHGEIRRPGQPEGGSA